MSRAQPERNIARASKPEPQHHTRTHELSTLRYGLWEARCSCGWTSGMFHSEEAAENEATDHVVAVTRGAP